MIKKIIFLSLLYLWPAITLTTDPLQITEEELQEFERELYSLHSLILNRILECSQDLNNQDLLDRYVSDQTSEEEKLNILRFCEKHHQDKMDAAYKKYLR